MIIGIARFFLKKKRAIFVFILLHQSISLIENET